jgi:hypothetical protein
MDMLLNPELWGAVVAVLMALAGLAVVITQQTASVKDDEYANKFLRIVQAIGGMVGARPKDPK